MTVRELIHRLTAEHIDIDSEVIFQDVRITHNKHDVTTVGYVKRDKNQVVLSNLYDNP